MSELGESPSKGAAAERLKTSLDQLWGEAADFDTERLCGFLDNLGPVSPAAVRDVHFDGHLLRRRARRAKRKAGGLDGWTGELVAALPLDFFDKLARLWTAVVKGGKLFLGWKQVRVAGIPKPDGGLRPLALTQMAWRLGASEMLAQLRPWFCAWMPECLHGGLPGRSVDAIHEQLGGLLDQRAVKRTFVGCKADVRKCFDRVSPQAAMVGRSGVAGCGPRGLLRWAREVGGSCGRFCFFAGGGGGFLATGLSLLTAPPERHDGHLEQVRPNPSGQHRHGHLS